MKTMIRRCCRQVVGRIELRQLSGVGRLQIGGTLAVLLLAVQAIAQMDHPAAGPGGTAVATAPATNDLVSALQRGLFEEEGNRDYTAAISEYQSLAAQFDKSRQVAATAIFRLGECYRKLGRTNEAVAQYDRILREFSDQQTLATLSRQNIAGLGQNQVEAVSVSEIQNENAELLARLKTLTHEQLRQVLPGLVPDATLTNLLTELDTAEQNLLNLSKRVSPGYLATTLPEYQPAKEAVATLNKKIDDRIDGILLSLELRAETTSPAANQSQRTLLEQQVKLAEQDLQDTQKQFNVGKATRSEVRNAERAVLRWRQQLAAIGAGVEASQNDNAELISRLRKLSREELRQVLPTIVPDATLDSLLSKRAEAKQKLVELEKRLTPEHPDYRNAQMLIETIDKQIDERVNGILLALELRSQTGGSAGQNISTATDDEDKEIRRIQAMIQNSPDLINALSDGNTPLGNAAAHGWLKVAAYLLDHGADVNGGYGSALFSATKAGNRAMVELLLSRGANINANQQDTAGNTPLHIAVMNGFEAVTEVLLANKADVNAKTRSGYTPLLLAAQRNNPKILSLLLEHKADANAQSNDGDTPLIIAAKAGQLENLKSLLAAGANPNIADETGRTALSFGAEKRSMELVEMLLNAKADPNISKLDAPLLCAIHNNDLASAEALLNAGADANLCAPVRAASPYKNEQSASFSPLSLAVYQKNLPMVKLLLRFKADPNDLRGEPMLITAKFEPEILSALLDAGANPNIRDSDGHTPLMGYWVNTSWTPPLEAVETLLKHGADPNARDKNGNSVLHFMAYNRAEPRVFELILNAKADPNVRKTSGKTPLDVVTEMEHGPFPSFGTAGPSASELQARAEKCAALLRAHGALDNLPDYSSIRVTRQSSDTPIPVFHADTNGWNQFTLIETILELYSMGGFYTVQGSSMGQLPRAIFTFPALDRIIIHRPSNPPGGKDQEIMVNLLNATNGIDCAKNVALKFGDVVEIPMRDHALNAPTIGLTSEQTVSLERCIRGFVSLTFHGQSREILLSPTDHYLDHVLGMPEAQSLLLSSSDLSRVKVIRRDSTTGKTRELVLDCTANRSVGSAGAGIPIPGAIPRPGIPASLASTPEVASQTNNGENLWLRDGDVIEVPEKP